MDNIEIRNAIIKGITLSKGDHNLLTAYIDLDYGGACQSFGGYALYLPKSFTHGNDKSGYAGHFIFRCLEIAGVDEWRDLTGKTIRVKYERSKIHAIGHIINEDWFNPSVDFKDDEIN